MDRLQIRYKLPPLLQPRLTWKYCLSSVALAYVVYCFLFNKPFFSSKLPRYTGSYGVGAIDIEVPVREPRLIHGAVFKDSGEPAFKLDTVLFTLYYPTHKGMKSKKAHHYWVPKPIHLTAVGYAKFAHVSNALTNNLFTSAMGILVGGTRIPAEVDVPLFSTGKTVSAKTGLRTPVSTPHWQDQRPIVNNPDSTFPIIVFSHGMASSRTQYSQYLSELASRGYVCAAIEHRDGSGPGTQVISTLDSDNPKPVDRLHFILNDVKTNPSSAFPDDPITIDDFKSIQLAYREAEILETTHILHSLSASASAGKDIFQANSRKEGLGALLASGAWVNRLNINQTILAGHSYGATGVLQALKPPKGSSSSSPLFCGGIILDPGKSSGPLNADIDVPVLIVHSTSWSSKRSVFYGRPHFDTVREIAEKLDSRGIAAWFMTSLGTSHPSVTDAPLLEPTLLKWTTGASIDVHEGVRQYVYMSDDFGWFLRTGQKRNLLACKAASEAYNPDNGRTEQKWRTFWQVHVSPVR